MHHHSPTSISSLSHSQIKIGMHFRKTGNKCTGRRDIKEGSSHRFTNLNQSFFMGIQEICRGQVSCCDLSQGNTKYHLDSRQVSPVPGDENYVPPCPRRNALDQ